MTEHTNPTLDGALVNLATGAGSAADPISQLQLVDGERLTYQQINAYVRQHWGCAAHVRALPNDATRKGFDLNRVRTPDGEADDDDAARAIQDRLEELGALEKIKEATIWARQYGGAILIAHVDDSSNVEEPLDVSGKADLVRLEVRSRHQIEPPQEKDIDSDPKSPRFGEPEFWRLLPLAGAREGVKVHASRVFVWRGVESEATDQTWDFGDSVLEVFAPAWLDYSHAKSETLAAVPRLAETRWGIKGLRALLSEATTAQSDGFKRYAGEIAAIRSALRIAFHDDDDTLTDASVQLQGAISLIDKTREDVAGAAGTSAQRFFGLQQQGMSNNDESGSERDDAATTAFQGSHIIPALNWLTEIVAADLGTRLESWQWSPRALREETPGSRAERQIKEAQARASDVDHGFVHENEVRAGLKKSGDLPYEFSEEYDETRGEAFDPALIPTPSAKGPEEEQASEGPKAA